MEIPEGFTRTQLGLPEDDGIRVIDRGTSTGLWHAIVWMGNARPATVFRSGGGVTTLYAEQWLGPDYAGRFEILHAPDEAVTALAGAGYQFADRRTPA